MKSVGVHMGKLLRFMRQDSLRYDRTGRARHSAVEKGGPAYVANKNALK